MERKEDGADARAAAFADALADLKERGSMLLLTGGDHVALDAACERLLGSATEPRRRLFALTDRATDAHPGVRTAVDDATELPPHVIRYETDARSAAATSPDAGSIGSAGQGAIRRRSVDGSLADLQAAITEELDEMGATTGDVDSGTFRICVDSVDTLLAARDAQPVFGFLHALSNTVRDVDGMCHVHLPAHLDDESVQLLTPLFDAVIETRRNGQQRWHLREPQLTTDWLSL